MKKLVIFLCSVVLTTLMLVGLFDFNPVITAIVLTIGGLLNGTQKHSYFASGMVINNMNSDFVFQQAKRLVEQFLNLPAGQTVNDQMITQATLRSEVLLNTTQTTFHIPVNQNDSVTGSNQYITEKRLGIQDLFVVTSIMVGVAKPSSTTDGLFRVYNYPSIQQFSAANEQSSLLGLFSNGYMRYENNGQVVIPYWDLLRHLKLPNQQFFDKPYYSASNTQQYLDEQNGSVDGFEPVQPGFVLSGASNINMNIILPSALTATPATSRLVVMQRGLLLQNLSGVR